MAGRPHHRNNWASREGSFPSLRGPLLCHVLCVQGLPWPFWFSTTTLHSPPAFGQLLLLFTSHWSPLLSLQWPVCRHSLLSPLAPVSIRTASHAGRWDEMRIQVGQDTGHRHPTRDATSTSDDPCAQPILSSFLNNDYIKIFPSETCRFLHLNKESFFFSLRKNNVEN